MQNSESERTPITEKENQNSDQGRSRGAVSPSLVAMEIPTLTPHFRCHFLVMPL